MIAMPFALRTIFNAQLPCRSEAVHSALALCFASQEGFPVAGAFRCGTDIETAVRPKNLATADFVYYGE
jgi:hypothetical protein